MNNILTKYIKLNTELINETGDNNITTFTMSAVKKHSTKALYLWLMREYIACLYDLELTEDINNFVIKEKKSLFGLITSKEYTGTLKSYLSYKAHKMKGDLINCYGYRFRRAQFIDYKISLERKLKYINKIGLMDFDDENNKETIKKIRYKLIAFYIENKLFDDVPNGHFSNTVIDKLISQINKGEYNGKEDFSN